MDITQTEIQNALRVLCRVMEPGETIEFEGGDLISIELKRHPAFTSFLLRTQDVAKHIHIRQEHDNNGSPKES